MNADQKYNASDFDQLAPIYESLWGDDSRKQFGSLVLELIEKYAKPNPKILDVACGTGQFAAWATSLGYDVSGADISKKMIEIAGKRVSRNKLYVAPLQNLNIVPGSFDVITCLYDSLNLVESKNLEAVVHNISNKLGIGGLFIFDVNTKKGFNKRWNKTENFSLGDKNIEIDYFWNASEKQGVLSVDTSLNKEKNLGAPTVHKSLVFKEFDIEKNLKRKMSLQYNLVDMINAKNINGKKLDIGRSFYIYKKQ